MRFPHPDFLQLCLFAQDSGTLIKSLGAYAGEQERQSIEELHGSGLPPVTSVNSLSVMTGFNPGFIWSMLLRPDRHYRVFPVSRGKSKPPRIIQAPKVGLKCIQTWLATHWVKKFVHHERSFGFVPGRSHVGAAMCHAGADWVISVDIENFFPSIERGRVEGVLRDLGYYSTESTSLLSRLLCLDGVLSQGSPASPVISNMVFKELDQSLYNIAEEGGYVFTRYADDIVFSGTGTPPGDLQDQVQAEIISDGWTIAEDKTYFAVSPKRLKVHGLLVHGETVRLTKGYRNKIRAYRHLLLQGDVKEEDLGALRGHLSYADFVEKISKAGIDREFD